MPVTEMSPPDVEMSLPLAYTPSAAMAWPSMSAPPLPAAMLLKERITPLVTSAPVPWIDTPPAPASIEVLSSTTPASSALASAPVLEPRMRTLPPAVLIVLLASPTPVA